MTVDIIRKMNEMIDSINEIQERLNNIDRKPKKRRLKKWFETVLIIINILAFIVLGSDSDSLSLFIVVHLVALAIFLFNNYLLYKYTDLFTEEL